MSELPKLNFPPCHLRLTERGGSRMVWDELRRKWLVLTPEEWVRRHLIAYLTEQCGASLHSVCQEFAVCINGQPQRADVVVCDATGAPLLLAECKEPSVAIDASVRDQAMRYNAVVGARYVLLTNGIVLRGWERTDEGYCPLSSVPNLRGEQNSGQ